jgi:hypothetical protein
LPLIRTCPSKRDPALHLREKGTRDDRVDASIAEAPKFARPILIHLRETTIEWLAEGEPRNWKYMNIS